MIHNSNMHEYLPVILVALAVLFLGCWNPKCFQKKKAGVALGYPDYLWVAILALSVGVVAVWGGLNKRIR